MKYLKYLQEIHCKSTSYKKTISALLLLMGSTLLMGCKQYTSIHLPKTALTVGKTVLYTSDKNYVITGLDQKNAYYSRGWINDGNGIVLKLNPQGEKIWEHAFPFLKYSTPYDIIEVKNQDIVMINPLRHNHSGGRGRDTISYLTRLNQKGKKIHQTKISGNLRKIVETDQGDLLLLGLKDKIYDAEIKAFVQRPFLVRTDAIGTIKWEKDLDVRINSISEMQFLDSVLYVGGTLFTPQTTKRIRMRIDLQQRGPIQIKSWDIPNSIDLDKENSSISLVKHEVEGHYDWSIQLIDHNTGKTIKIPLGEYAKLSLLPQIRLEHLHVCTQLNESPSSINQVAKGKNGAVYLTIPIIDDLHRNSEASLSTQAYCHRNLNGFLIIKINENYKLEWIKRINDKALPLQIAHNKDNELMIVGTQYDGNQEGSVTALEEKLYFFLVK